MRELIISLFLKAFYKENSQKLQKLGIRYILTSYTIGYIPKKKKKNDERVQIGGRTNQSAATPSVFNSLYFYGEIALYARILQK